MFRYVELIAEGYAQWLKNFLKEQIKHEIIFTPRKQEKD
jgi:hypothetical protein